MKCLIFTALAILSISHANPVKRFAGFGISSISSIGGGNLGCVVTGDKLYINGLYEKDLSSAETNEFQKYLGQLKDFKQEVKGILEARRNASIERRRQWRQRGENDETPANDQQQNLTLPDPPQKPSFCTGDATTQYIFDGCKVQNNKVYVGNQYARDLTSDEISELKTFDQQMTAFQSQVNDSIQKQVQELFGQDFGRFFGSSGKANEQEESNDIETAGASSTTPTPLQAPEAPNFCTVIY